MISYRQLLVLSVGAPLLALVAACGSDSDVPAASTASLDSFVTTYNQGLASVQAMNNSGFADLFDDSFLDAGYNKSQVLDNIKQDAASASAVDADAAFPAVTITNASVSACDDNTGFCTLTATYANPASDGSNFTTSVPVRYKDGKFRLYGDQKSAS